MAELLVLMVMRLCFAAGAQVPRFDVLQPESVSGVVGGSVVLPCNFSFPEIEPFQDVNVYWRIHDFHGEFIYNHKEGFTRPDYNGRIFLVGDPLGKKTASIEIKDLRKSDSNAYFCRVHVKGNNGKIERWQYNSINGIKPRLTVSVSSTVRTSTRVQTTSSTSITNQKIGPEERKPPIAVIIGVVAGTLLLICIIGITCFFLRRSRGGRKAQEDAKEPSQKEAPQPEMYASVRKGASKQPEQPAPESRGEVQSDGGLVYASLNHKVSNTARKEGPRAPLPEEETVYTAVRRGAPV